MTDIDINNEGTICWTFLDHKNTILLLLDLRVVVPFHEHLGNWDREMCQIGNHRPPADHLGILWKFFNKKGSFTTNDANDIYLQTKTMKILNQIYSLWGVFFFVASNPPRSLKLHPWNLEKKHTAFFPSSFGSPGWPWSTSCTWCTWPPTLGCRYQPWG